MTVMKMPQAWKERLRRWMLRVDWFLEDHPAASAAWDVACLVICLACFALNVALATGLLRLK